MAEPCVSSVEIGNKWWFDVFRLSPERGYETVVRGCPRLGDLDWDYSRKFGHTNPLDPFLALKANELVWYAPDQNYGLKYSAFVPFFGIPAATATTTARRAMMTGAAIVPYVPRRLEGGGYLLEVLSPLEDFPSGDDVADTARLNRAIEQQVGKAPEQYLWVHRRFKDRPEGERDFYEPSKVW